jgi:hypothetical protein
VQGLLSCARRFLQVDGRAVLPGPAGGDEAAVPHGLQDRRVPDGRGDLVEGLDQRRQVPGAVDAGFDQVRGALEGEDLARVGGLAL